MPPPLRVRRLLLVAVALSALTAQCTADSAEAPAPSPTPSPEFVTARVKLKLVGVDAVSARENPDRERLQQAGRKAARNVRATLRRLYREAFVDPGTWARGDYEDLLRFFDPGADPRARDDLDTLTLGLDAGERFEGVESAKGTIALRILVGRSYRPVSAVARVSFQTRALVVDDGVTLVVSRATYFLETRERRWVIVGYRAEREDRAVTPAPPSP